jgi:4-alpha-glucanotransferase
MKKRKSGILLHITCLPSPFGIGDLGPGAYKFANFLERSQQRVWQVLPLTPTTIGNSPYYSPSAFAGNPLLISPEKMNEEGFLENSDIDCAPEFSNDHVEFGEVHRYKYALFKKAFEQFPENHSEFHEFCVKNKVWLDDYSLFTSLKNHFEGKEWNEWPAPLKMREPDELELWKEKLCDEVRFQKFLQFVFYDQWFKLKDYCNEKEIQVFGDIPIYVTLDSADAWANPEIFKLNSEKKPWVVAGVPPDYFSETGQLWGNPVYDWDSLKDDSYRWWIDRLSFNLEISDIVRIDHFRGFLGAWEIPAGEETAVNGQWQSVPGADFFAKVFERFPTASIVAEDLGYITPDVREVMDRFELPGMKLLVFAFGSGMASNPYILHNHIPNCVVYTGTHDCNTIRGWFENDLSEEDRLRLFQYLNRECHADKISWEMIRMAMMSTSRLAIIPIQDILGLGAESRFNFPGTLDGNWEWRMADDQITPDLEKRLSETTYLFGRGRQG